jgi:23S rRNA pseudouridine2605 synthase
MTMRLHKFLAQASALSRRSAEQAIAEGRVSVNRQRVTAMGVVIDPDQDLVCLDGTRVGRSRDHHYLVLYKPKQSIVTKSDPQGRRTIWSLLPQKAQRLNAVGRLDFESEGLLLLTDDGDLHHQLTHPTFGVAKEYLVKVRGTPAPAIVTQLCTGLEDAGETLKAEAVKIIDKTERNTWLRMTLHSGRYRQIRRMCEQLHHPVLKLKRVAFGPIRLGTLRSGRTRRLTPRELARLRETGDR